MGCCCASSDKDKPISDSPQRLKKCQDIVWLILFIAATWYSYKVAFTAKSHYKPIYSNGADSWGNICGWSDSQNHHSYARVIEGENHGYPVSDVNSMSWDPAFPRLNHTKHTVAYASTFSFTKGATMVCLEECPGEDLETAVPGLYTESAKMNSLAALVSAQPASVEAFEISVKVAFSESKLAAIRKALWCPDVLIEAGYADNSTAALAICTTSIKKTVLTPSSTLYNRCTPHYKLALKIGAMAEDPGVAANQTYVGQVTNIISEGTSAILVYKRQIMWSFLGSIAVALLVILLIQVLTKYIIMTVVLLFALSAVGAMLFTVFRWKQLEDPTWMIDCSGNTPTSRIAHFAPYSANEFITFSRGRADIDGPMSYSNEIDFRAAASESRAQMETRLKALCSSNTTTATGDELKKKQEVAMYIMAGVWVFSLAALITICCCCSNIWLAVTLFDEAGQCVFAIPGILIQPIWTLFITAVTFLCLMWKFIYVTQVVVPIKDPVNTGQVLWESKSLFWNYWWVYTFFVTTWVLVFVDGCHQVSLAGAVSDWFWKHNDEYEEDAGLLDRCSLCPARKSMQDMVRYNLGSIALGSMMIAIVRTIQVIIWLVQKTATQSTGGKEPNKLQKAIFCCLQCCLKIIEKFLEFINRNAYIGIAIFGYSFCRSAQKAIALKVENAGRAVVMVAICSAVLFLGKIISVVSSIVIFHQALKKTLGEEELDLNSTIGVYAAVGVFSWWITSIFLSVYGLALDTIFICFCEDQQRNNGRDRPYKSSVQLQKFMRENA